MCQKRGKQSRGMLFEEVGYQRKEQWLKGEGALCFGAWHSLAWLDSRPLLGSQVFSPGAANSLWWCSYMFNYALEPACLYLCLIEKHSFVCLEGE